MESVRFGSLISQWNGVAPPRGLSKSAAEKALRNLTVLVADDDDDIREVTCEVLTEENGWRIIQARTGPEALALAVSERPDAIILDHRMPDMSGAEVLAALRAAGHTTPVVLITAASDVRDLADSLGVDMFLGKPFGFDQLTAVVVRAIVAKR